MNIIDLEKKLHNEIPMTKLMNLSIKSFDNKKLITQAPLDININDKGTAFGGSLSTITTISAWSTLFLLSKEFKIDKANIVIINSQAKFLKPVTKDIVCETFVPSSSELQTLQEKLSSKKSASIKICSHIIEDNKVCVDFEGIYVIKII